MSILTKFFVQFQQETLCWWIELGHNRQWVTTRYFSINILLIRLIFTFSEELREHFGKIGEIESITVKIDPATGRSRGFAFLVFKNAESLEKVKCQLN